MFTTTSTTSTTSTATTSVNPALRATAEEWPAILEARSAAARENWAKKAQAEAKAKAKKQKAAQAVVAEKARLARHQRKLDRRAARRAAKAVKRQGLPVVKTPTPAVETGETNLSFEKLREAFEAKRIGGVKKRREAPSNPKPRMEKWEWEKEIEGMGESLELALLELEKISSEGGDMDAFIQGHRSFGVRWMLRQARRTLQTWCETGECAIWRTPAQLRSDLAAFKDIQGYLRKLEGRRFAAPCFKGFNEAGNATWIDGSNTYAFAMQLFALDLRFAWQVEEFLPILEAIFTAGRSWNSCYQPNFQGAANLAKCNHTRKLPFWAKVAIARAGVSHLDDRPGSIWNLLDAARAWRVYPGFPKAIAIRLGRSFGDRPSMITIAAAVWEQVHNGVGYTQPRQEKNDIFWGLLAQAFKSNRIERAKLMWKGGKRKEAVRRFYGHPSRDAEDLLFEVIKPSRGVWQPELKFPTLKVKALEAILEAKPKGLESFKKGAVLLAVTFGNRWKEWLNKGGNRNRTFHDATFWLPSEEVGLKGLADFLMRHHDRTISDLGIVSKHWGGLTPEQQALPFKELVALVKAKRYAGAKHEAFAAESAQWGISESNYASYEARFIASLAQPDFHPEVSVEYQGLKGVFLRRADVRGLYLGHYTNSCQHPDHRLGHTCAWYGQESKNSGFLVIFDLKTGIIAGEAWAWETPFGLCLDNFESKGLGERDAIVGEIVKRVAQQLASNCKKVTMGTGLGDLACLSQIGQVTTPLALPMDYSGYTDAGNQVLLAENPDAVSVMAPLPDTYVRGLREADFEACSEVAQVVYPEGWQFAGSEETDYGLVLIHKSQIVGYATMETANRYISDIAVLETARAHSKQLVDEVLADCHRMGGEWSADCRESTSYRLLKLYERRGRVQILSEDLNTGSLNGEPMHRVCFTVG